MTTETPRPATVDSPATATATASCVLCGHDRVEDLRQLGVDPVVVSVCNDRSRCVHRYADGRR